MPLMKSHKHYTEYLNSVSLRIFDISSTLSSFQTIAQRSQHFVIIAVWQFIFLYPLTIVNDKKKKRVY